MDNLQFFYNFLTPDSVSRLTLEAMNLLRRIITLVCIVATFVATAGDEPTAKAKGAVNQPTAAELKPLQGSWEGEGAGGKCSIIITGNSLYYRNSAGWYRTTFTLPVGTDPQQLHATIKDCSPPSTNAIGTVVFAIFKIEDGTLIFAEDDMSDKPPKTFANASSRYSVKKVHPQKENAPKTE